MSLSNLPNEILLKVFGYLQTRELKTLRGVCRQWFVLVNKVFLDKFLFCIKCVEIKPQDLNQDEIQTIKDENNARLIEGVKCFSSSYTLFSHLNLVTVNLSFSFETLDLWKEAAKQIVSLTLRDCTITDGELFRILGCCSVLKILNLHDNCFLVENSQNRRSYNFEELAEAYANLSKITVLNLAGAQSFGLCDGFFVKLVEGCKSIEELDLSKSKMVFHKAIIRRFYTTSDHWSKPSEYVLSFAILMHFVNSSGHNLRRINFSGTKICKQYLVTLLMCETLRNLSEVIVNDCIELPKSALLEVKSQWPRIIFKSNS